MKFAFICTDYDGGETTLTFEEVGLHEVLRRFADFLRGSGFYFVGELQVVNEEEFTQEDEV
jgi:hypothetical protein